MKHVKSLKIRINPTDWDSILVYPQNIEYVFKLKPYANNHIQIWKTAIETKWNMIQAIWNQLITDTFFTAILNDK